MRLANADHRGYEPLPTLYPLAQLGVARTTKSRKAYDGFLTLWKDADCWNAGFNDRAQRGSQGNVAGNMTVFVPRRRKELLAQIEMDAPLYSRPALVGDALYLATANRLFLNAVKPLILKTAVNTARPQH
jgi:hypothetical protein